MDFQDFFRKMKHDPGDPDPWLALYLDRSLPIDEKAKAALLKSQRSFTRRVVMPIVRPFARLSISGIKLMKILAPASWQSPWLLHRSIYWGLRLFVAPEANYLILRHFTIGTEILKFIEDNVPGIDIETTTPLRTRRLEDLLDNTFTVHDLTFYNFIIELNEKLRAEGREIEPRREIDYSAITDDDASLDDLPNTWLNVVDLQTAIEIYTPLYALFLADHHFWRASNSLQLDEIIALYVGKILNDPLPVALVHNHHPMVPRSTLEAGFRLTLHGLDSETLHGHLKKLKEEAKRAAALGSVAP
ncbi:DUF6999 family protein [Sorangium sp. So ce542]|uniref:DUF6999 family protein n=1 Tax=Sorangium sp. So ce542 TaxID=3133316 RepID=UPI003F5FC9C7